MNLTIPALCVYQIEFFTFFFFRINLNNMVQDELMKVMWNFLPVSSKNSLTFWVGCTRPMSVSSNLHVVVEWQKRQVTPVSSRKTLRSSVIHCLMLWPFFIITIIVSLCFLSFVVPKETKESNIPGLFFLFFHPSTYTWHSQWPRNNFPIGQLCMNRVNSTAGQTLK